MKTLDEVIKAFEICIGYYCSNAEHDVCPYFGESDMGCMKEPEKDALHYLKEYRTTQTAYIKAMADLEDNPPLTWDELKQMEGKPVWVELTYEEGHYEHWGIISGFPKVGYEFMTLKGFHAIDSFSVMEKEQGRTWQAYRKERS